MSGLANRGSSAASLAELKLSAGVRGGRGTTSGGTLSGVTPAGSYYVQIAGRGARLLRGVLNLPQRLKPGVLSWYYGTQSKLSTLFAIPKWQKSRCPTYEY
jgi:hypothetical protein